jgi:hypothetical protein
MANSAARRGHDLTAKCLAAMLCSALVALPGCFSPPVRYVDAETLRRERAEKALLEQESIERRLAGWQQDHEDLTAAIAGIFDPGVNIEGAWTTRLSPVSLGSSNLIVRREEGDRYAVEFSTGGCLGQWRLDRGGGLCHGRSPPQQAC